MFQPQEILDMHSPDEVVVEDWDGLESEMERLLMVYGYPSDPESETVPHEEMDATDSEKINRARA